MSAGWIDSTRRPTAPRRRPTTGRRRPGRRTLRARCGSRHPRSRPCWGTRRAGPGGLGQSRTHRRGRAAVHSHREHTGDGGRESQRPGARAGSREARAVARQAHSRTRAGRRRRARGRGPRPRAARGWSRPRARRPRPRRARAAGDGGPRAGRRATGRTRRCTRCHRRAAPPEDRRMPRPPRRRRPARPTPTGAGAPRPRRRGCPPETHLIRRGDDDLGAGGDELGMGGAHLVGVVAQNPRRPQGARDVVAARLEQRAESPVQNDGTLGQGVGEGDHASCVSPAASTRRALASKA